VSTPEKPKQGLWARLREKRRQRRQAALERGQRLRGAGIGGDAMADLARRHPDHMGGGG
jgi:hypothetical protein